MNQDLKQYILSIVVNIKVFEIYSSEQTFLTLYVPSVPEWDIECRTPLISFDPLRNCCPVLRDRLGEEHQECIEKNKI